MPKTNPLAFGAVNVSISSPFDSECVPSAGDTTVEVTVVGTGVLTLYALIANPSSPDEMKLVASATPPDGAQKLEGVAAGSGIEIENVEVKVRPSSSTPCQNKHHSALNVLRVWLEGEPVSVGGPVTYASDLRVFYAHDIEA